ncbi:killer suppression protein HigA [Brevibacillus borstelensis]|uniref:type II toxin-antitoxin system RelE/ParE family toxin n=1 Tax=Brevibacillus borstelensis TaxID=45462 RepID=UPI000F0912F2|nr:killer suppression protein HigA [Brevibacillus borstelensis]MED1881050.1 killer suppression protein HigA [Brevibacillus borstelensis]RNB66418.1 killer suppression protein HigA [Brevibacillus borstelensis]GED53727.1 toxin RelE [Brevibacillus borstelensis]
MNIYYANKRIARVFDSKKNLDKTYGVDISKKIQQRLFELNAANSLDDISHLPPARCHELNGERAGQFAVDLKHPHRLIFTPGEDPVPRKADGSIDRKLVTSVIILEVVNYHD